MSQKDTERTPADGRRDRNRTRACAKPSAKPRKVGSSHKTSLCAAWVLRGRVSMGRIPPGKESFIFHAIWPTRNGITFCLVAVKQRSETKPLLCPYGSFMGFPTPSLGHSLMNTAERRPELYLMGERESIEVAEFPTAGKMQSFSRRNARKRSGSSSFSAWLMTT